MPSNNTDEIVFSNS